MSNLVTTGDGVSLASVEEAAADEARLVRERSLYATSANGFLTGTGSIPQPHRRRQSVRRHCRPRLRAELLRGRPEVSRLLLQLGLRAPLRPEPQGERSLHTLLSPARHGPGLLGRQREARARRIQRRPSRSNHRIASRMRGNGKWSFTPSLSPDAWPRAVYRATNITALAEGLSPAVAGTAIGSRVQGPGSQRRHITDDSGALREDRCGRHGGDLGERQSGASWIEVAERRRVGRDRRAGDREPSRRGQRGLRNARAGSRCARAALDRTAWILKGSDDRDADTGQRQGAAETERRKKRNHYRDRGAVGHHGALARPARRLLAPGRLRLRDIASQSVAVPRKFTAVAYPAVLSRDAHLTYRMDAPAEVTRLRLRRPAPQLQGRFLHRFPALVRRRGHLDTFVPPHRRQQAVRRHPPRDGDRHSSGRQDGALRILVHNTNPDAGRASGFYSLRMEVNHRPPTAGPAPIDVTLRWNEVRANRTTVARSHRQRVKKFPIKYVVNVGGSNHPVMESITVNVQDDGDATPFGYSDGVDAGGQRSVHTKRTEGCESREEQAVHVLTGTVGLPGIGRGEQHHGPHRRRRRRPGHGRHVRTGGADAGAPGRSSISRSTWERCEWPARSARTCSAIRSGTRSRARSRIASKSSRRSTVSTSPARGYSRHRCGGRTSRSITCCSTTKKRRHGTSSGGSAAPVSIRYVRYRITPARILCASELQVLDRLDYEPFDIRLAAPRFDAPSSPPPPPPAAIDEVVLHAAVNPQITGGWIVTDDATAASGRAASESELQRAEGLDGVRGAGPGLRARVRRGARQTVPVMAARQGARRQLPERLQCSCSSTAVSTPGEILSGAPPRPTRPSSCSRIAVDAALQGWGWADNGYGVNVPGPLVYFATTGAAAHSNPGSRRWDGHRSGRAVSRALPDGAARRDEERHGGDSEGDSLAGQA